MVTRVHDLEPMAWATDTLAIDEYVEAKRVVLSARDAIEHTAESNLFLDIVFSPEVNQEYKFEKVIISVEEKATGEYRVVVRSNDEGFRKGDLNEERDSIIIDRIFYEDQIRTDSFGARHLQLECSFDYFLRTEIVVNEGIAIGIKGRLCSNPAYVAIGFVEGHHLYTPFKGCRYGDLVSRFRFLRAHVRCAKSVVASIINRILDLQSMSKRRFSFLFSNYHSRVEYDRSSVRSMRVQSAMRRRTLNGEKRDDSITWPRGHQDFGAKSRPRPSTFRNQRATGPRRDRKAASADRSSKRNLGPIFPTWPSSGGSRKLLSVAAKIEVERSVPCCTRDSIYRSAAMGS